MTLFYCVHYAILVKEMGISFQRQKIPYGGNESDCWGDFERKKKYKNAYPGVQTFYLGETRRHLYKLCETGN
jgi:hypothetical protein